MMKYFLIIKKIWKSDTQFIAIITAFFLTSLLFIPSNKILFAWSVLYFLIIFVKRKSIDETIISTFFPFSLLQVGQQYVINVISPQLIASPLYPDGRSLYFSFSPFFAFLLLCIGVTFIQIKKYHALPKISWPLFLLCCALGLNMISAFSSEYIPFLAIFSVISQLGIVGFLFILLQKFQHTQRREFVRLLYTMMLTLCAVILFQACIVGIQSIKRSTLHLTIETSTIVPYFGAGADENAAQFRPIGLATDANSLANLYVSYFFILAILFYFVNKTKSTAPFTKTLFFITETVVVITLILTQSRSAYLVLVLFFAASAFLFRNYTQKMFHQFQAFMKKYQLLALFSLVILLSIILDRSVRSIYSFSPTGGFTTRFQLITDALQLISLNKALGVGSGMYIPAAFKLNPDGAMKYFPESVHNGFLLYIAENGLIAFGLIMISHYIFIRKTYFRTSPVLRFLLLIALISNYVMMLFQPFNNWWNVLVLFSFFALEMDTSSYENKK